MTDNAIARRRAGIRPPQMGDGGGSFASMYHGGIATDAGFDQVPTGRIGMQREGRDNYRTGPQAGDRGEVDAHAMLMKYAQHRFGDRAGDMDVEAVLESAWQDYGDDPTWQRAIATTAYGMGVAPPWEKGPRK